MLKQSLPTRRDTLYREKRSEIDSFVFDDEVVSVFPDMIQRSIPGYDTILTLTGVISAQYLPPDGLCYDLGCSLGASTECILRAIDERPCSIIGLDSSQSMIDAAKANIKDSRVHFECADIRTRDFDSASVIVLNFVLQFVPVNDRQPLLTRIAEALQPNGVLVLSEKIQETTEFEDIHLEFKRFNQYSDLEISQKRTALEKVMQPDSVDTHVQRLKNAGFQQVRLWFRCLNWVSLLAKA